MPPKTASERDKDRRDRLRAEGKTARIVWIFPEVAESLKSWVASANSRAARRRKSSNSNAGLAKIEGSDK